MGEIRSHWAFAGAMASDGSVEGHSPTPLRRSEYNPSIEEMSIMRMPIEPPDATREAYVERVLSTVEQIPPGRVATYGDVAEVVGIGGPRQVGQVMSAYGSAVCWWRVIRADGHPVRGHEQEALAALEAEGTPLHGDRVDLRRARWRFAEPVSG